MLNYIVRRLAIGLVTLFLITFLIYGLIRSMPGSPLDTDMSLSDPSRLPSQADIKRMEKVYGLDKPWYQAYWIWLGNLARWDLGHSFVEHEPVSKVIANRIPATLTLSATSLFLSYLLAVPMGLFATVRSGKLDERVMSVALSMLYSPPSFVAALLLPLTFAVQLEGTIF